MDTYYIDAHFKNHFSRIKYFSIFKCLTMQRLSFLKMQGKKPSKILSLLQKEVSAKEKFKIWTENWQKDLTIWPIILPLLLLFKEESPFEVTSPLF